MVFLALLEYGLILWMRCNRGQLFKNKTSKDSTKNMPSQDRQSSAKSSAAIKSSWTVDKMDSGMKEPLDTLQNNGREQERYHEKLFDKISIIIFPTSFLAFNIWYWFTYL